MFYTDKIFLENIQKENVNVIIEIGSYDLYNTFKLLAYYEKSKIYCFECNPECFIECQENLSQLKDIINDRIILFKKAICEKDGFVSFFPFDLNKYHNKGASSMLKIDFSMRDRSDPDYNKPNPQKEIVVEGLRLDTFCNINSIHKIDLLCLDITGYELNAIKSLGLYIKNVKYILMRTSIQSTYTNGACFKDIENYLKNYNFKYSCSNRFGYNYPDLNLTGLSELDVLFTNQN
jgi:FkbM family methyltransferase